MASIASLRDALQTRLNTLDGLVGYDVALGGGERLNMSVGIVFPRPGGRQITNCETRDYRFVIEIHVSRAKSLARAQDTMDALIDPKEATGVKAAIMGDKTLGGAASSVLVGDFESYQFGALNGADTLVARVPVQVIA